MTKALNSPKNVKCQLHVQYSCMTIAYKLL